MRFLRKLVARNINFANKYPATPSTSQTSLPLFQTPISKELSTTPQYDLTQAEYSQLINDSQTLFSLYKQIAPYSLRSEMWNQNVNFVYNANYIENLKTLELSIFV